MPSYSQANRPIKVKTALGPDDLLLTGFRGNEAVSRPFGFQLDMMSENTAIDPNAVLRESACVTVKLKDGSERKIHGIVNRFVQLGISGDLAFYRADIVPWLWFLSLSRDCRIFQEMSVLEIIEKVFKDLGFTDFKKKCTRSYPKREYCVQYRETHLDFVSRLMEDEGIFYFFEHSDSKHTLVLADGNNAFAPYPGNPVARFGLHQHGRDDMLTRVEREDSVYVGKVTLRDYDPLQPSLTLKNSMSGDGEEEVYDYQPVIYTQMSEGDRYARLQLEAEESLRAVIRGEGLCKYFQSGCTFSLEDHYRADMNREYALLSVEHSASAGDFRSWDGGAFDYRIRFSAIPSDVVYRPQRRTPRPFVRGSQTAVVVGKSGEEIWTDKHGRVKIQFHWDHEGKKNENSSCWVRVSSAWAGKAWGAVHIPRIGQEVVVDFLEGDPDRPLVTGRVYNAEQTPPYSLPANQTQSGIKSRSSKGGGTDNFNEIRMEDKKGSELLYIHAEKDKQVMVENDRTEEVGHDETITIGNDRTEEVGNNEAVEIKGKRNVKVGKDHTEDVKGKETLTVTGARKRQVKNSETVKISSSRASKIGTSDTLKVGTNLTIKAGVSITLKVGGNSIKIDNMGITIKGTMIKLQANAIAEMKGAMVKVQGDGMLQAKAPMSQVNGDGILMLKGGLTMIN
ncbi:MAG: type VI secretion system tip protein TssI/VgrG [Gemmatimonadota bacterium]|jgi:type VI secretion system secreted protein VgrG